MQRHVLCCDCLITSRRETRDQTEDEKSLVVTNLERMAYDQFYELTYVTANEHDADLVPRQVCACSLASARYKQLTNAFFDRTCDRDQTKDTDHKSPCSSSLAGENEIHISIVLFPSVASGAAHDRRTEIRQRQAASPMRLPAN